MLKFLILSLIATFPIFAQAVTYRNFVGQSQDQLHSEEGADIYITAQNYQSGDVGDNQTNTAEQIQVVVTMTAANRGLSAAVHVTLIQNCWSGVYGRSINKPNLDLDLMPSTDGSSVSFFGQFSGVDVTHSAVHGGDWTNCQPQLAIAISDSGKPAVWQTDPVTKTHNFNLENF